MIQMSLLDYQPRSPMESVSDGDAIYLRALNFIDKNPVFWEMFEKFTFDLIKSGRRHYGCKAVFERIRWETALSSSDDEDFKINNNYTAIFARIFAEKYPQHSDFFLTRSRPTEKKSSGRSQLVNMADYQNHRANINRIEMRGSCES